MCGITGLVNFSSYLEPNPVETMTRALRYRGPDDEGYIGVDAQEEPAKVISLGGRDSAIKDYLPIDGFTGRANLYLGHRRLAILDLSTAGHQPMQFRDKLWIVYNGEVYNYLELRHELKAKGYEFNTGTDTEVILAAYHCWGEECVTRFNGDWAFCILDTERHTLFLSRDRYGIKPLYFFRSNEYFCFASEIKALLSLPFVQRSLNREKAFDYHVLQARDHTEETLYDGIYNLRPGQSVRVDIRSGETQARRYYELSTCKELGEYDHRKALSYAMDIRDLLFEAVRLRLRADVPVGTCLSGGLDSSAIVAIMANLLGKEARTKCQNSFTASFPGEPIDESRFARSVADSTGSILHFIYPSRAGYWRDLPAILHHQDEPYGGASIYSQWEVMREASKHVKVVLDGQGGDEVFAGYKEYRAAFLAYLLENKRFGSLVTELFCWVKQAKGIGMAIAELKILPFFVLSDKWKREIYCIRYHQEVKLAQEMFHLQGRRTLDHIDRKFSAKLNELLFYYITAYSLPRLLMGEDRNSMAHSIEARVPFTDHRLVDYVFSIPAIYKIRHGWTKWLLRLAVEDLLPSQIVWRRDKLGFATPRWASRQAEWDVWIHQNFYGNETESVHPSLDFIA